ncbi:hypothetical protein [Pseudomonas paeninsulae]|uniref:hypothetical protein n=1 Tax=Pseudomonas paeninsulae TaxID=3110772 RepID=UPI002D76A549|nr:hypothetical protein [Pseudomonas sp. IT1137]
MRKLIMVLAAAVLASQAHAASVMKCVDAAGKVTFVQNANCPRGNTLSDMVSAHNAAPSGSSASSRMAAPSKPRAQRSKGQSFVVVGEQPAPVAAAPAPVADTAPRGVAPRPNNQPCIKIVERIVTSSQKRKDGGFSSRARMVKIPVAC